MKISIIGCGYVGVVTGLCLADKGHKIYFFDKDKEKITNFKEGKQIIFEKNLKKKFNSAKKKKNIFFCDDISTCINKTSASFICVGTPFHNGNIDLKQIKNVTEKIAKVLVYKKFHTIIYKSTIPPLTIDNYCMPIFKNKLGKNMGKNYKVISNPEFLREGNAISDFENPKRIVVGIRDNQSKKIINSIYSSYKRKSKKIYVDLKTAEFIKYFSNSFFSLLISFSNEIANLSQKLKIDFIEVLKAFKLDARLISNKGQLPEMIRYLKPGIGYGGSCFPKDIKTFIKFAELNNHKINILKEVDKVNTKQPIIISKLIKKEFILKKIKKCLFLGIAFKENTDDIRNSTGISLLNLLSKNKFKIYVYDDLFSKEKFIKNKNLFNSNIKYLSKLWKKINFDAIIINNKSKKYIDMIKYYNKKNNILIYDSRRILEKSNFKNYLGASLSSETVKKKYH